MKSKLVYVVAGALLALTLTFGALALQARAQSGFVGPKWEYLLVNTQQSFPDVNLVELNGRKTTVEGNVSQLFSTLGLDGWEYVGVNSEQYWLFKRPTQ